METVLKKYHKARSGFTLIELLVVVSIIGVLVAISIFGLSSARQSARDGRRKSDIESIRSALELYKADCNVYPSTIAFGGTLNGTSPTGNTCLTSTVYLQAVPTDPGSASYRYSRLSNSTYELCATLEVPGSGSSCGTGGNCSCGGSSSCGSASCKYKATNP